jgi:F-type H+-transporting ATPase subunit alpha
MKKIAGTLKLDQAQYRELEAFAKFGSDLDAATKAVIDKGVRNVEILKQGQYQPLTVGQQQAIIYCGVKGLLGNVPAKEVRGFEENLLSVLETKHSDILESLGKGSLTDEVISALEKVISGLTARYEKDSELEADSAE